MLDGKELVGQIGNVGSYSADIDDAGILELSVGIKIDLVAELEKLAAKTETPVDDKAIAWVKSMLVK